MSEHEFAYVGTKPCGCTVAAMVISPKWAKDTAREVAKWIRAGYSVDKVSVKDASIKLKACECEAKAEARWKAHIQTLPLF